MAYKICLVKIATLFLMMSHATSETCTSDRLRTHAVTACNRMTNVIKKRQTDLLDFGYNIEIIKAQHHHHHHHTFAKISHSNFPNGGYLLVQYPFVNDLFTNQIDESETNNEISNDILEQDLLTNDMQPDSASRHHQSTSIKNKYSMKFKRNANAEIIKYCCSSSLSDCRKYNCH